MIMSIYQLKRKSVLTRLAVSDGADCPRFEFRILTKLLCSVEPAKQTIHLAIMFQQQISRLRSSLMCNNGQLKLLNKCTY